MHEQHVKAVIYARLSSEFLERKGYSIPAQIRFLSEEAGKRHLEVDIIIHKLGGWPEAFISKPEQT